MAMILQHSFLPARLDGKKIIKSVRKKIVGLQVNYKKDIRSSKKTKTIKVTTSQQIKIVLKNGITPV